MSFYENHSKITKNLPVIFHNIILKNDYEYLHWHENIELIYCIDGEGTSIVDSQKSAMKKGVLTVVNSGRLHHFVTSSRVNYYCLIINYDFLKESGLDLEKYEFCEIINDENVASYFDDINREYFNKESGYEIALRAQVLSLMTYLFRNYKRCAQSDKFDDTVKKAMKYIRKHYKEKITLEQVSDAVGFSKFHFARRFKTYTNITVNDYIRQVRCNEAESLLKTSDWSVSDIATGCGFEDVSYFTKVFKKETGHLPSQIRKNSKGDL
ncbi:MAG: AraC family transcriptional regulator [Clostridia bacterium]|nr:AraC family transcriptional regulator [Clostridia bacterium]